MQFFIYLCILGYVMCEYDLEQVYNQLASTKEELLSGQWTTERDHLIYIKIVFDNQNLQMQVFPQNNSMLHLKHQFTLKYELSNSSYYFDSNENLLVWKDIKVGVTLDNKQETFVCNTTLYIFSQLNVSERLIIFSDFDQNCVITKERIKLFIYSEMAYIIEVRIFTIVVLSISIFQIVSSAKYLNSDPMPNNGASLTMSIILTQDIYICLFSSLLFEVTYFFYFTPCLIAQSLVILQDLKVKSKITKVENQNYFQLFLHFAELMIISYLYIHIRHSMELTIMNLFLTPQILYTCFSKERQKFNKHYIGIILPRSLYTIYARGSADNILQLAQRPKVVYVILFILALQLFIYYCQCQYGWFILCRKQYNYFIDQNEHNLETDCAICLYSLSKLPEESTNQSGTKNSEKNQIMNTPCNHQYHSACLTQWMEISLVCPLCRTALPQIM